MREIPLYVLLGHLLIGKEPLQMFQYIKVVRSIDS